MLFQHMLIMIGGVIVSLNNLTRWCKELEMRDWNNYNRTTSGTLGNGLLAPKGVNASGGMDDYENTLITVRSNVYGEDITC